MSRHTRKNQRKRSRKQPEDEDDDEDEDLSRLKPEETADLNVSFPVFNVPEGELTVSSSTLKRVTTLAQGLLVRTVGQLSFHLVSVHQSETPTFIEDKLRNEDKSSFSRRLLFIFTAHGEDTCPSGPVTWTFCVYI